MKVNRTSAKIRRLKKLFLLCFTLIGVIAIYSIYQYNQGLSEGASEPGERSEREAEAAFEPFEGEDVQFGEIKILLIGDDAREGEKGRSDTLMIAHYNQDTNEVKIASLMRDIYVEIPGHGMHKLNTAFAIDGPELVRQTIKHNFDIDVNYYAIVDFDGFPKVVDLVAPDGIEIKVPERMSAGIGMTLEAGTQTLYGEELLGYVRFRKDSQGDFGRVERQQEVLSKVKNQAASVTNIVHLPRLLGTAESYIDTNIDNRTLLSIGKGLITENPNETETLRIPVNGSFIDENVDAGAVLNIDFEENAQVLKEFFNEENKVAQKSKK